LKPSLQEKRNEGKGAELLKLLCFIYLLQLINEYGMFEMGWWDEEPADMIVEISRMSDEKELKDMCRRLNAMVVKEVTFVGDYTN
jgi:hypothetical protein